MLKSKKECTNSHKSDLIIVNPNGQAYNLRTPAFLTARGGEVKLRHCRCEPGWFPENTFYTDPNGTVFHLAPGGPHVTSTCDSATPPDGPGTLVYKLIVGSALTDTDNASAGVVIPPSGPAPLTVDPDKDIFDVLPGNLLKISWGCLFSQINVWLARTLFHHAPSGFWVSSYQSGSRND